MIRLLDKARETYNDLGFDTLPLCVGSKRPYVNGWQSRSPFSLWHNTPPGLNIGIRGGGLANVAFFDCDAPQSFETITKWLSGIGYLTNSYPVIQTASMIGRHIYVTFNGGLSGEWRVLSQAIGPGEFRYGTGAYVVVPPSSLSDGSHYSLLCGDYRIRPALDIGDIMPLLGNCENKIGKKLTLSRKANNLLHGKNIETYSSRSEAEQALLVSLINTGFSFGNVLDLFNRYPCAGKYKELKAGNAKNAERWLFKSYNKAVQWAKTHESKARQFAQSTIEWAESKPWPGRTGAVDRLVFLAHASIAHRAGSLIYAASCRDLAERSGVSHMTATRATYRLCDSNLIVTHKKAVGEYATVYQLDEQEIPLHFQGTPYVRRCNTLSAHDVFRHNGLGKSAAEVWQVLLEHSSTVEGIAYRTGREKRTIKRVLDRMARIVDPMTGDSLSMVGINYPIDGNCHDQWHTLQVDLDVVAQAVGTAGKSIVQQILHAKDRRNHSRVLRTVKKHVIPI